MNKRDAKVVARHKERREREEGAKERRPHLRRLKAELVEALEAAGVADWHFQLHAFLEDLQDGWDHHNAADRKAAVTTFIERLEVWATTKGVLTVVAPVIARFRRLPKEVG